MNPMKSLCTLLVPLFFVLSCSGLHAGSTTSPKGVVIGDLYSYNWRSKGFKGSSSRNWNDQGTVFQFAWKTSKGNQIGRIGKSFYSPGFGVRVDDTRDNLVMSTNASMKDLTTPGSSWYIWSIYGWTHAKNTKWPMRKGWNNEFYIVFKSTVNTGLGSGYVSIGSVSVNGVIFDCFTHDMPWGTSSQTQWMAVSRKPSWNASVDLKKIFAYWRSQGLANEYIVDLTWAFEGGAGSSGKLSLSNLKVPKLVR